MAEKLFAADWFPFHETTPSPDQINAAVLRYAELITASDFAGVAALFAPDGYMDDPVGSPPIVGHAAIQAFFESGCAQAGGSLNFKISSPIRVAGRIAAATTLTTTAYFTVESIGVITFNEDCLITNLKAYYGATNVFPVAS